MIGSIARTSSAVAAAGRRMYSASANEAARRPGIGVMPRLYAFAAGGLVGVGFGYYRVYHEFSSSIKDIESAVLQLRNDTVKGQQDLKRRVEALEN